MTVSAQRLRLFQGVVLLLWIITVGILTLVLVDINAKNESAFSKQLRFSPLTNSAPINGSFSRGAFVDSTMTVPEEKINEDLLHVPSTSEEPISRSKGVAVTCDVRGNLGPCSVVVQDPPGSDWLKDRWYESSALSILIFSSSIENAYRQAASDMGGTAIKGVHWIVLDFGRLVKVHQVILDWETAFARAYRLEGNTAYDATMTHKNKHIREEKQVTGAQIMGDSSTSWDILYDGTTEIEKLGYVFASASNCMCSV